MIYLATGLVIAWSAGLLFLAGRALNFVRLIYNNFVPGKNDCGYGNFFRFYFFRILPRTIASMIDPASLTEVGRQYRKGAIRNERIMLAWMIGGFALIVWATS
jgi:hypothetical protein